MNERIKELAIKSIANVRFWNAEKEAYDISHDELIEFAELIVKECTNMLPEDSIRKDGVHMYYVIREHFGITPFRGDGV